MDIAPGRRLSCDVVAWVVASIDPAGRFVRGRRLTGGITSSVHGLTVEDRRGRRHKVVLRRWTDVGDRGPKVVSQEADVLEALEGSGLPAPRLVATDPSGEAVGDPALLMTHLPGRKDLAPSDPERWLRQIAGVAARIHAEPVKARPFRNRMDATKLSVPEWSSKPDVWRRAIEVMRQGPPAFAATFTHRDYQHFNMLWSRGRLFGIVDWVHASMGPPDVDVSHCRLNLAVLFSAERAERFRLAYEAEAGRTVDAWWDIAGLFNFGPGWKRFIPIQAGRNAVVDLDGMYGRVDDLMEIATSRL